MSSSTTDQARYGFVAHEAIASGLLALKDELDELVPKADMDEDYEHLKERIRRIHECLKVRYKATVLEALNSTGLPGGRYTWDGVRKASTNFLCFYCVCSCRFLLFAPSQPAFCSLQILP